MTAVVQLQRTVAIIEDTAMQHVSRALHATFKVQCTQLHGTHRSDAALSQLMCAALR